MNHYSGRSPATIVAAGKTDFIKVPEDIELWVDIRVLPNATPGSGTIMFGSAVLYQDGMCFPMNGVEAASGNIAGFKIVGFAQLPSKTVSDGPPANCMVSLWGQFSCGKLGIVNGTDVDIQVIADYRPRRFFQE